MIVFLGGLGLAVSGMCVAVRRHQSAAGSTPESLVNQLKSLSDAATTAIQTMNPLENKPEVTCHLSIPDMVAMYHNSRIFLRLASKLMEQENNDEVRYFYDKISETHDKLFTSLVFCIIERSASKVARKSLGAYTGIAAWFYSEQISLLEVLSSECSGRESLQVALEGLY
jgi:hypothetical protein